ncbi:MAG: hypothetical protein KGL35_28435 [Bradyrhizobium sp.]|nr:hypothetical protein [Pseudomonadota bacterium]MDE2472550.1 hypothetical protein [Bradyrhizobium sp.]
MSIRGRPQQLLLDILEVLKRTPRPFAADTKEKRAALNHFESGKVLVSDQARRARLRPLHEKALDPRTLSVLSLAALARWSRMNFAADLIWQEDGGLCRHRDAGASGRD